nr:retrotransposon protein [Tanacetum cinerariifolium]
MKPSLEYFRVFGCKVFIVNTKVHLTKFDPQSYEGVFLGYSQTSKAYIVLNKETLRIEESLNVTFYESFLEPKSSSSVKDDRIIEPTVQNPFRSPSLEANASEPVYPKALKKLETTQQNKTYVKGIEVKHLCCFNEMKDRRQYIIQTMVDISQILQEKHQLYPHLNAWADVLLLNVFIEIKSQENFPIIVGHMLYCIKTNTPFNFAYFIAQRLSGLDYNNEALPYARVMMTLFEYLKNKHPNDVSRMIEVEELSHICPSFIMESLKLYNIVFKIKPCL